MSKALRAGVYILAAYGGCVLIDKKATKWLYSHKDEIVDKVSKKIEKLIFGKAPTQDYSKPYNGYSYKKFCGKPKNVSNYLFKAERLFDASRDIKSVFDTFNEISVTEILGAIGHPDKATYIDTKWGWKDLAELSIQLTDMDDQLMAYIVPLTDPVRLT